MHRSVLEKLLCTKQATHFLGMAIDRYHEQDNGAVKASDGAVGFSANPAALRSRTVTCRGVARCIAASEKDQVAGGPGTKLNIEGLHHE